MASTEAREERYTGADWNDFAHTGPGTLAGRYMRMFWHPVYRSQDVAHCSINWPVEFRLT